MCVGLQGSAFRRDLVDDEDWDKAVRGIVWQGEDPPLEEMARARMNDLTAEAMVKGRSLVSWMLSRFPACFLRLCDPALKDSPPEDAFLRVFGAPPEAVERRWRLWALRP